MTDEEWLADLEDHIRGGRASVSLTTGTCKSLIRLARKGLAAEKLAEAAYELVRDWQEGDCAELKHYYVWSRDALAAFETATKEEP